MNRVMDRRAEERTLHVRFEGRSVDIPLRDLDLGVEARDLDVMEAVSRYLDVPVRRFQGHVVERHAAGNWTLRPEAVFG
jgi:hypothetical protein